MQVLRPGVSFIPPLHGNKSFGEASDPSLTPVNHADQVDGRQAPHQAAHDVVVEVLVTQQPEQANRPWLVA